MKKDQNYDVKVAMDEEAVLAGFCTVCKEKLGFWVASTNKRSFPGFEEAEESVKWHRTKKEPVTSKEFKFSEYFEWCKEEKQHRDEQQAKENEEKRLAKEWHWLVDYELCQEELHICHIEAEALHALAMNQNKDVEQ